MNDTGDAGSERMARYLAGECAAGEAAEFERWLDADPARRAEADALRVAFGRLSASVATDIDVEAALRRAHGRIDESEVRPAVPRRAQVRPFAPWQSIPLRLAASLAVFAAAATLYFSLRDATDPGAGVGIAITHETAVGQVDTLVLADGSTVILAPASRLVVAAGYGDAVRHLELSGVAHFEVVHDVDREFVVRAGGARITDLGTAFVVRAEPDAPVSVLVTTGAVRLDAGEGTTGGVILREGDRGTFGPGGVAAAARVMEFEADLAWTRGSLVFDDAPFHRVAADLRRWYGIQLVAADSTVAARRLTATFEEESVDDVIAVVTLALGAVAEHRADRIVLRVPRP